MRSESSTASRFRFCPNQFIQRNMGVAGPNGISGMQCRMARAGLRWNLLDLERYAKVSRMTIVRFEKEVAKTTSANIAAVRRAFEAAGVEFIGETGVDIKQSSRDDPRAD